MKVDDVDTGTHAEQVPRDSEAIKQQRAEKKASAGVAKKVAKLAHEAANAKATAARKDADVKKELGI